MELQRRQITDGSATAKALDYSLKRWGALTRFVDDGQLPIDNNWAENQIRPIAIGRKNWLFAGSLRAGCGTKVSLLSENQSIYIPQGEVHRLTNPGVIPLEIIEVQSGSYLGEDDIVRFEDTYGRSS